MKTATTAVLLACLTFIASPSFAQDSMTKSDAKNSMSMRDCKDHAAMAKGEKRSDAAVSSDVDKQCANMMKSNDKKAMRKDRMTNNAAKTDNIPGANTTSTPMK
jgi:hypothetical protein